MGDYPRTSSESSSQESQKQVDSLKYRCVCGKPIVLENGFAQCGYCHRTFKLKQQQAAETVLFTPSDNEPEGKFTTHLASDASPRIEVEDDRLIGTKLGHFRILSTLGGGGMGKVYRALDESLQRHVALKVILQSVRGSTEDDLQAMFQEARSQARLNHPHVAHIYYVGIEKEMPFLAMELVGKATLADRIKGGPLPFDETVRYTLQIAMALEQAARFDIVHGDVKPANVLVVEGKEKSVKLSDFGMAKRISQLKGDSEVVSGTPNYIPPEATYGKKFDHRGDMYSLGITLFEMAFGRLPYPMQGKKISDRIKAHRKGSIEFPEIWPNHLPLEFKQIIEKLLAKKPEDRYENFSELISDLKKIEPVSLPTARPLLRGLAWAFDSFLILSVVILLTNLLSIAGEDFLSAGIIEITRISFSVLFLLGVGTFQGWRGSTPGKSLFQVRIVDKNGLRPGKSVLFPRTIFQFLWAWGMLAAELTGLLNLEVLTALIAVGVTMVMFIEMGFVLFDKGMSFHDRLLNTRVVLDAAPTPRL